MVPREIKKITLYLPVDVVHWLQRNVAPGYIDAWVLDAIETKKEALKKNNIKKVDKKGGS